MERCTGYIAASILQSLALIYRYLWFAVKHSLSLTRKKIRTLSKDFCNVFIVVGSGESNSGHLPVLSCRAAHVLCHWLIARLTILAAN